MCLYFKLKPVARNKKWLTGAFVFQISLRQMNQTRFYVVENVNRVVQVSLLIGGLPALLTREEYVQLIQEHLDSKSESDRLCGAPCWSGLITAESH